MITCTNCKTQNEDGSTFCGECGTSLKATNANLQNATENFQSGVNQFSKGFQAFTPNQKKGVLFVVLGLISFFVLPLLLNEIDSFFKYSDLGIAVKRIIPLGVIIAGIYFFVKKNDESDSLVGNSNQLQSIDSLSTESIGKTQNKVIKVTLVGGLIGLFAGNASNSINKKIATINASGWEVIQILPDTDSNILTFLIRIILVVITLFFYTTNNGYYIVIKKSV
jgi:zinc-ribbon domain